MRVKDMQTLNELDNDINELIERLNELIRKRLEIAAQDCPLARTLQNATSKRKTRLEDVDLASIDLSLE